MSNTQRQFTLIGNFTDNITPELNRINSALNQLRTNFQTLGQAVAPLNTQMAQLTTNSRNFNNSLSSRAPQLRAATTAMNSYTRALNAANAAAQRLNQTQRSSGGGYGGGGRSTGGGGGYGRRGYGRGGYGGDGFASQIVGYQIANTISGAILSGFQMGVNLMEKPFQYFASAFGERIKDEMSDIQAAGGLFAISQRKGLNMFPNFSSAMRELQRINYKLAQSAAALPGATEDYVKQGKLLSDTVMTAMGNDPKGFTKLGQEFGAKVGDKMDSLGVLIQKLTEKSVLIGMGNPTKSPLGTPQLIEQLINAPAIGPKMFQKYVAFRNNPIFTGAFQDPEMQKKLAATKAGGPDRVRVVMELLDMILPNEVIQAYKNSTSGFLEAFRSSFLDPEVGLFGLGRKFGKIGKSIDEYGRYLNKQGQVVKDAALAAEEDYSLFEIISKIIKGFGLPLSELTAILPQIWDPLRSIAELMMPMMNAAQDFYRNFIYYTKGFENIANSMGLNSPAGQAIKKTAGARGFVLALTNFIRVLDDKFGLKGFYGVREKLMRPNADLAGITKDLFAKLFQTDFPYFIGKTIGGAIGSTIKMLGDIMSGATNIVATGPFAEGLAEGWKATKGSEGVKLVFESLFKVIGNTIQTLFQAAPMQMSILAALTVGMPIIQQIITFGLLSLFGRLGTFIERGLGAAPRLMARASATVRGLPGVISGAPRSVGLGLARSVSGLAMGGAANIGGLARGVAATNIAKIGETFRGLSGRLLLFGAALQTIISLFQGKNIFDSLASGAGPAIGAAIGSVLLGWIPIVGPLLGAVLGAKFGQLLEKPLSEIFKNIWGSFQGLMKSVEIVFKLFGDLSRALGKAVPGINAMGIAMAPFTLAFQALEMGLKGLATLLAWVRMKFNQPGAWKDFDEAKRGEMSSRARINAYNDSLRGSGALKSGITGAQAEINTKKNLDIYRIVELKAYIEEAKAILGGKPSGSTTSATGGPSPAQITAAATSNVQTATNIAKINPNAARTATETARTAKNTQTSATTLGNLKSALFVISNKMDILNSMLFALEQISTTLKNEQASSSSSSLMGLDLLAGSSGTIAMGSLSPKLKALLSVIRFAEGTSGPRGYQTLFGGSTFSDMSRHPDKVIRSGGYASAAAGAYQIMPDTYKSLGGGRFTEVDQDRMALQLIARRGINLSSFDFSPSSINKLAPEWASFPTLSGKSYYNQPVKSYDTLKKMYDQYLRQYTQQDLSGKGSVAMALGSSNPAFFSTRQQAEAWEKKMMPAGAKVATYTMNSSEGFGGMNVNAPITIYQQPGQDPEELATIVVTRLSMAVEQMRNHYA
jgi:muramidase (phage lysozyme)